jgi:phosphoglycerol transferase MdoB-like AlkP superfamily enzyme
LTQAHPNDGVCALVLRVNGAFLLVAGSLGVTSEVLSHFWGIGPWGHQFLDSPYTVGFFEAHGLALVISILLLTVATSRLDPYWHLFAAAVAAILGCANLLFWQTFIAFNKVPLGVATTALHLTLFGAQLWCYARARRQVA